jgi:hypothetical protein
MFSLVVIKVKHQTFSVVYFVETREDWVGTRFLSAGRHRRTTGQKAEFWPFKKRPLGEPLAAGGLTAVGVQHGLLIMINIYTV